MTFLTGFFTDFAVFFTAAAFLAETLAGSFFTAGAEAFAIAPTEQEIANADRHKY